MAAFMAYGSLSGKEPSIKKHVRQAKALGTDVSITVFHSDETVAHDVIDAALANIEHVEKLMSLYRPDSQLSVLNRTGVLQHPHPDILMVLRKQRRYPSSPRVPSISPFNRFGTLCRSCRVPVSSFTKRIEKVRQSWREAYPH